MEEDTISLTGVLVVELFVNLIYCILLVIKVPALLVLDNDINLYDMIKR